MTTSPPTTISDETVEIAAKAIHDADWVTDDETRAAAGGDCWDTHGLSDPERANYIAKARAALLAAVPYIEAGLRERLATEIEATQHGPGVLAGDFQRPAQHFNAGIRAAARVARGTQEATK